MSQANALEQLMLNLINEERAAAGVQPLRFDDRLNDASEDHSAWMLDSNRFSHTGEGGSSPTARMENAGFEFEGAWRSGENIGWQSERGDPGLEDDVEQIHDSLMRSPGHRANILNPDFEEIGIGIERGDFTSGSTYDSVMVTQNFATTDAEDPEEPAPTDETDPPVVTDVDEPATDDGTDDPVDTDQPDDGGDDTPVDTVDDPVDEDDEEPVDTAEDEDDPADTPSDDGDEPVDTAEDDDDTPDGDDPVDTVEDDDTPDEGDDPVDTADDETPDDDEDPVDTAEDDTPDEDDDPVDMAEDDETPADDDGTDAPADDDMAACEGDGIIFVNFGDFNIDFNFYGLDEKADDAEEPEDVAMDEDNPDEGTDDDAPCVTFDVDAFLAQVSEMLTQIDWELDGFQCSEMA